MSNKYNHKYIFSYFMVSSNKKLNIDLNDDVKEIIYWKYRKLYYQSIIYRLFYNFYTTRIKNPLYVKCKDCNIYILKKNSMEVVTSYNIPSRYKRICKSNCRFKYPCGHFNTPTCEYNWKGFYDMQTCDTCNLYQYIGFYWIGSPPFLNT